MPSIIDFAEAYRTITQAGQEIAEGNVVRIVADNGRAVGDAVKFTVIGGNGVGATVYTMTKATGATAITTGVSFLALELPTACLAIAPALGIAVGYGAGKGLQALAPEFWLNVSNALFDAGETLGGKVLAYFDGYNIGFDDTTIETVKNQLLNTGIFAVNLPEHITTPFPIEINGSNYNVEVTPYNIYAGGVSISHGVANGYTITPQDVTDPIINFNKAWWFNYNSSGDPLNPTFVTDMGLINVTGILAYNEMATYNVYYNGQFTGSFILTANQQVIYNGAQYVLAQMGSTYLAPTIDTKDPNCIFTDPYHRNHTYCAFVLNLTYNNNVQDDATLPNENPFTTTYPQWLPWEYPIIDPSGLPEIFPIKYPSSDPNEHTSQDEAQDPDEESETETLPRIIHDFPLPDPDPDPEQEDETDPDPQPDPEPEHDTDGDTDTGDDPVDPNPDPIITPIIPTPNPPSSVGSNKLFTVYNPTSAQLDALGAYLWDSSLVEIISKFWQNPMDGIISLMQVYVTPSVSNDAHIILGYLDSGVTAKKVSSQFVTVDCGTVTLSENKKNATDYSPYTSLHLFLPFIGITELDVNECMGGTIGVKYDVDVYTGTCLATVTITRTKDTPNGAKLYTFSGNCSQQIPLTSGNATALLGGLISAVGTGLAIASGGGLGIVAGATMIGNTLNREMLHVSHSGNISANAGIMGNKKPYLIIGRQHGYDANGYYDFYGYPANKTVFLGNCSGFVRVKDLHLHSKATESERVEIESLLKQGVIL